MLEKNYAVLCDDIEAGRIGGVELLGLEEESLKKILMYVEPDKERADELRSIFAQGFDEPVASKIWPKLIKSVGKGYGAFRIYTENLKKYMGDIPHINPGLFGPETFIADHYKDNLFKLNFDAAYFEFIPVSKGVESDEVLTKNEIQTGQEYRLVVTTLTGLYRYVLDDVIKVEDMDGNVPVISYAYDVKNSFVLAGHYITVKDIYDCVYSLMKDTGLRIDDYSYHPVERENALELSLELHGEDEIKNFDEKKCTDLLEKKLFDILGIPEDAQDFKVRIIPEEPETSQLRSETLAYTRRVSYSQVLPRRLF